MRDEPKRRRNNLNSAINGLGCNVVERNDRKLVWTLAGSGGGVQNFNVLLSD